MICLLSLSFFLSSSSSVAFANEPGFMSARLLNWPTVEYKERPLDVYSLFFLLHPSFFSSPFH